ncbi:response regulator [Spirillospora sp. CA-142024]|uniref:response regulator n=1 Tax=Spirillospora sp. CA-142024 TaxID=3240036 RepID=UPI003D92EFEF
MTRVLVVDDSPQILATLRLNLRARHYEVQVAPNGAGALTGTAEWHPDLVILDLGLPDLDGVEVIRGLRGWTEVPIIVLSGRAGSADKVDALDAGADDYVTKPFGVDELLARIRAITRRVPADDAPSVVEVGRHSVDLAGKIVYGPAETRVHLTPTEWGLLEMLLRNPGKLISQRRILAEVWSPNHVAETNYLRVYMAALRRKLEDDPSRPRHLITEPGMGYRFEP